MTTPRTPYMHSLDMYNLVRRRARFGRLVPNVRRGAENAELQMYLLLGLTHAMANLGCTLTNCNSP